MPGFRPVALGRRVQKAGPGDFAENITTEVLNLPSLVVGSHLLMCGSALAQVTQIDKQCDSPCATAYQLGECVMPREDIFVHVPQPDTLRLGELIQVLDA